MDDKEHEVASDGWWVTSRPYRVVTELILLSVISLSILIYMLSRASDLQSYRFFGVNPIYIIGVFSGSLGGLARSFIKFLKREGSYNMKRSDYWKHVIPFYIGSLFGFVLTLVIQSGLKLLSAPTNISDAGGLSFLSMICLLSGLFADRTERKLLALFDRTFEAKEKGS